MRLFSIEMGMRLIGSYRKTLQACLKVVRCQVRDLSET